LAEQLTTKEKALEDMKAELQRVKGDYGRISDLYLQATNDLDMIISERDGLQALVEKKDKVIWELANISCIGIDDCKRIACGSNECRKMCISATEKAVEERGEG
jgi:hypothetical protein